MTLNEEELMEINSWVAHDFVKHVVSHSGAEQLHCWYMDLVKASHLYPWKGQRLSQHRKYLHITKEGYDLIIDAKMASVEDFNLALAALMTFIIEEWEGENENEWFTKNGDTNEV